MSTCDPSSGSHWSWVRNHCGHLNRTTSASPTLLVSHPPHDVSPAVLRTGALGLFLTASLDSIHASG